MKIGKPCLCTTLRAPKMEIDDSPEDLGHGLYRFIYELLRNVTGRRKHVEICVFICTCVNDDVHINIIYIHISQNH